jgi:hypothetical protein
MNVVSALNAVKQLLAAGLDIMARIRQVLLERLGGTLGASDNKRQATYLGSANEYNGQILAQPVSAAPFRRQYQ